MKLFLSSLLLLAFNLPSLMAAETKPNIILFMAEDIGCDIACYGTPAVKTPTLDKLAKEGILYKRFYTNSPICSPSRTSIMCGMYQTSMGGHHHRSRIQAAEYVKPLTHYLREAGYFNVVGSDLVYYKGKKIDINFKPSSKLFDSYRGWNDKKRKKGQPFFNQIQLKTTHRSTEGHWAEVRKNSKHPVNPADVQLPPYLPDTPEVRLDWANYLDTMEYIDAEIAKVMEALKKDGELENSIIIFIGDNGRCQVRGKSYLFEDGILCPMIIHKPGLIPGGQVSHDLVAGIDLTATILQLAGIKKPEHMQGQAFLQNDSYKAKEYIFSARDRHDEIKDCSRAIVSKRYKYIYNFMPEVPWDARMGYYEHPQVRPILPLLRKMNKEGKLNKDQAYFFLPKKPIEQLYDLEKDPWELNNLAESPEYQEVKKDLKEKLFNWIESSKDLGLKKVDGKWLPTEEPERVKK